MLLSEMPVRSFIETLASSKPAPGGGSAAALAGAMGSALVSMVASLTVGKEKYREYEPLAAEILAAANKLADDLVVLVDRDTEAFNKVSAVFAMPKETDEDKAKRREAMQEALKIAAVIPLEVMDKCLAALRFCDKALGKTNVNAISDLGVGSLNLKSALQGAWLNVLVNLAGIHDKAFIAEKKEKGTKILEQALPLADKIYVTAEQSIVKL